MRGFLAVCILLIVAGEISTAAGAPFVGIALDAVAVALLASSRWHFTPSGTQSPPDALMQACVVIAMLPIMRLLSVTMPLKRVSDLGWYVLIGLPLLPILMRLMGEQPHLRLQLRASGKYLSQGLIALIGIPLGMFGYVIAHPDRLASGSLLHNPVVAFVILTVFSGLLEEVLFRGLLSDAIERFFGPLVGILGASALFAIFNAGAGGLWFAIFALYYGFTFALIARRTGSLVGVSLAHGLLNTGLIVVWPRVWG